MRGALSSLQLLNVSLINCQAALSDFIALPFAPQSLLIPNSDDSPLIDYSYQKSAHSPAYPAHAEFNPPHI